MNYKDTVKIMLNQGLIKKQKVDFSHIEALLLRAQKDLIAAKANLKIDEEITYNYAYLAMLRCGRSKVKSVFTISQNTRNNRKPL